ncbi:hypothetical protein FE251_09220 [Georgenia wutianyii]|uniref:ATP-binding protein n=1 Tax=Georgenia wutianyii TaxID=2585135 RepID=A0ABX5VM12_9MICO|nr:hypothetical protein [Georgenia wutianyii]QDB79534.1 hypothetical protein FE251_09220 [Georgenia wutianyii]
MYPTTETTPRKDTEDKPDRWDALRLADFIEDHYTLGVTDEGATVAIPNGPHDARIAVPIRSLAGSLRKMLRDKERVAVSRETMTNALDIAEAAAHDHAPTSLALRVARKPAAIEVDLGDTEGRYVEISAHGYEVRNPRDEGEMSTDSRAAWKRSRATQALPVPVAGGSRDDLRNLLGLAEDDPRWRLLWGWAVGSFFADIPRPILWALGPQGSGKSTRAKMMLNLVDPAEELGKEPGKNERDDTASAAARFVPSWDNIGNVSAATSDWICRLVTGVEVSRRALYTDGDLHVSTIKRTGVATSIVLPFGLGPDALERLVLVEFERVNEDDRRPESALWGEYRKLRPGILGALYADVAGALAHLSAVRAEVRGLPRMADYALVLHALDRHHGLDADAGHADAYMRHLGATMSERAQSDPLTAALIDLVKRRAGRWKGTAEALHNAIDNARPSDPRAGWPTSALSLSSALTKNAETLRAAGLSVTRGKSNGERFILLERLAVASDVEPASEQDLVTTTPPAPKHEPAFLIPPTGVADLDDVL